MVTHGVHIVIIHGTDDKIVPIRASVEMNNRVATMLPPNAKGDNVDAIGYCRVLLPVSLVPADRQSFPLTKIIHKYYSQVHSSPL